MSWPEMPGCLLRLRYAQVSADSADLDELPDWSPHAGRTGSLKPSMGGLVVYDPGGARIVFDLDTVKVEVDADGWLCKRPADGGDLIPLRVAPTDDPLMSVTGWRWTLTLGARTIGPFPAPSSGVVELADYVTAPAVDATKAWVERIPELIELLTGAGVAPEAVAAAVADYLAANPIEGVTVADVLAEIAAHEGEADPHPQYVTESELPDVSDVVREGDTRLTDARTPTAHGHTAAEVEGLGDALAGKADTDHDHAIGDVTGLQDALDGKQASGSYAAATHNHDGTYAPVLGPDDNYISDAEKAALHSHANKAALDEVSGVNTGDQDLSGYATTTALTAGLADKADAAHSHALADVTDYSPPDLSGYATTASLSTVATSGAYADLTGTPTIPDSPDDIGAAPATQPINTQTTAYTLTASDAGKLVTVTSAAAVDVTVPAGVFSAGERVDVLDLGAERVTFVAGAGMTLGGTPSLVSRAQYSAHSIVFLSASQAVVVGDLGAA